MQSMIVNPILIKVLQAEIYKKNQWHSYCPHKPHRVGPNSQGAPCHWMNICSIYQGCMLLFRGGPKLKSHFWTKHSSFSALTLLIGYQGIWTVKDPMPAISKVSWEQLWVSNLICGHYEKWPQKQCWIRKMQNAYTSSVHQVCLEETLTGHESTLPCLHNCHCPCQKLWILNTNKIHNTH